MKFFALAIALLLVPQDEKITIKFNPKKGDKLAGTTKMELQLKLKIEAGDEVHEMEFEQRGSRKELREFADVADGKVTKMVVDCTEAYEEKKQKPMMPDWTRKDEPMHGRKVTISLKDGETVREGAEGLDEKALRKLDLKDVAGHYLPKTPVAVGESWEIKGDEIRDFLQTEQEMKDAKVTLKLTAIKEIDKRRCAIITGTLEASGKAEGEAEFKAKMDLDVVVWIERGYLLSAKGKGKVTVKSDTEQMTMSGEGPITIETTVKVD